MNLYILYQSTFILQLSGIKDEMSLSDQTSVQLMITGGRELLSTSPTEGEKFQKTLTAIVEKLQKSIVSEITEVIVDKHDEMITKHDEMREAILTKQEETEKKIVTKQEMRAMLEDLKKDDKQVSPPGNTCVSLNVENLLPLNSCQLKQRSIHE